MSLLRRILSLFVPGPRRPLAMRQPQFQDRTAELGMEATDMKVVDAANRRNQSLDRSNSWNGSFTEATDRSVRSFKDDANYARDYHRLYGAKDETS
ncbi:hypothetical protein [Cognatishimia sp.]|uniref:hypothetical protein n=1 Tax=Cognatishimia sp. TaxID=2211648 RepID=UPI0035190C09